MKLTVTVVKRKKTKRWEQNEKIEDVFVTEEGRGTRNDITKEMKIEQLHECQVSKKVPVHEWLVDGKINKQHVIIINLFCNGH